MLVPTAPSHVPRGPCAWAAGSVPDPQRPAAQAAASPPRGERAARPDLESNDAAGAVLVEAIEAGSWLLKLCEQIFPGRLFFWNVASTESTAMAAMPSVGSYTAAEMVDQLKPLVSRYPIVSDRRRPRRGTTGALGPAQPTAGQPRASWWATDLS